MNSAVQGGCYPPRRSASVDNTFLGLKKSFYYIKVSGIASGNKLIKTIRYPHV